MTTSPGPRAHPNPSVAKSNPLAAGRDALVAAGRAAWNEALSQPEVERLRQRAPELRRAAVVRVATSAPVRLAKTQLDRAIDVVDDGRAAMHERMDDRWRRRVVQTMVLTMLVGSALFVAGRSEAGATGNLGAPLVTDLVVSFDPARNVTTFRVHAIDPADMPLAYRWKADIECGSFVAAGSTATWTRSTNAGQDCVGASGAGAGPIAVTVTDGTFDCLVVYRNGGAVGSVTGPVGCQKL